MTEPAFVSRYVDLASPRLGSEAVFATDEFFAAKERMLTPAPAVFMADKYDDHGKWMDGWETRRRRGPGHDHCIVRLGVKGRVRGVDIDTSHFTGNYPPAAALEACLSEDIPGDEAAWTEIVPSTSLGPNAHHFAAVDDAGTYNYLRLHIYPDGGVARLRVYGEPVSDWQDRDPDAAHELSALVNGGRIVADSDAHYGDPSAILTMGRGADMGDGWETRRRREPGNDWIILALGHPGTIEKIEVDTAHFKGNYPDRCSIQAALVEGGTDQSIVTQSMFWPLLLDEQKLEMDRQHVFDGAAIEASGPISHVRLNSIPDGGISRLRLFGKLARQGS